MGVVVSIAPLTRPQSQTEKTAAQRVGDAHYEEQAPPPVMSAPGHCGITLYLLRDWQMLT